MKEKTSAKDLAFDKERAKYRQKIRELEHDISTLKLEVVQKECEVNSLKDELQQKDDWIRRLLEYTELSEKDMKSIIEKEKVTAEMVNRFSEVGQWLPIFGRF